MSISTFLRFTTAARPIGLVVALVLTAWLPTAPAADIQAPVVTLKSGRSYHVYGDILVPVETAPGIQGALAGSPWPHATLSYTFDDSVTAVHRDQFRQWSVGWEGGSGVRVVENASASNRVLVQTDDGIGCGSSVVGMSGGVQDLVIGCWSSFTVQHELGHALGAIHEQQRSDRDEYVEIVDHGIAANCGDDTWDVTFGLESFDTATAYDYASIMHYAASAHFSCNGVDAWAEMTALQAQPPGPPAGSENACTNPGACQAIMGSSTISLRDRYGMALRYGYRIVVERIGNGGGTIGTFGDRDSCGTDCHLVTPDSNFTVSANPVVGSVATISVACHGTTYCAFHPTGDDSVLVRFTKQRSIAAVAMIATRPWPYVDTLFADGFDGASPRATGPSPIHKE